ncbi:membrane protein [Iodidimonas muriae]|uniref:Membrane protein n=2 Tax=Iodidimonas muriae TaxID=261467 RepID=A0ABQ2L8J9_9PROT|nr:membrane protein [Kordiimonadales bacterium JCM 17843]GGO06802.1 membrane protein [Iodidimonas muriae]
MQNKPEGSGAKLALIALFIGAIGIGFAPIFVRYSDIGPVSTAFWRMVLSVPLLALWMAVTPSPKKRPYNWGLLALCGLFFAADLGLWHWSIALTSVANATLLTNLNPVFVALAGFVLFQERFSRLFLLGLVAALVGAVALMGASLEFAPERLNGDLLGMASAVMYAGYFITAAKLRANHGAFEILVFTAIATAIALLGVALVSEPDILPATPESWLPLIALTLVSQIMGQGLIVYALAHLPAAFSAVGLLLQPLIAALAAWLLFAERLGPWELAGGGVVLLGIVLARLGSLNRRRIRDGDSAPQTLI